MVELSNWGRWGKEDQLGTLNLVTPEKRKSAAALVWDGLSISLSRNAEREKAPDNGSPFELIMNLWGASESPFSIDTFKVQYHGMSQTHIDSLCHVFYRGKMYNGYAQSEVAATGALKLGIENFKTGILSRGVLIDIPWLRQLSYLEPGSPIVPAELNHWEMKTGLKISAGDVVLIRTGRWARRAAVGAWSAKYAGPHGSCARWLKERDVALLGMDASEVMPSGVEGVDLPLHQLSLVAMGLWILDNCDLEALGAEAQRRKRWEFLFTVAPLAVPGGTGSPVNPIVTF